VPDNSENAMICLKVGYDHFLHTIYDPLLTIAHSAGRSEVWVVVSFVE
jgi:hypothetical protein